MEKDPYEVLGVHHRCSQQDIKDAYRELIKQFHPDIPNTGDQEKFSEIQEAYKILGSPNSRRLWDDTGYVDQSDGELKSSITTTLRALMTMFLSRGEAIFTTDIVKESNDYCKAKIQENAVKAAELRNQKKFLKRVAKKFKRKKSERHDFLRDIIATEINSMDQNINQHLVAIHTLENVKLVINDYEFDFMRALETNVEFNKPDGRVGLGNIFDLAEGQKT